MEYAIACQRSGNSSFCLRVDDSSDCYNSYNVICSAKISNSFFIQDCNSLHECMFCAHISNKKYCIANMQFEKKYAPCLVENNTIISGFLTCLFSKNVTEIFSINF